MDKIIIINDSGIQKELEEFLIANKKHIWFSSDMDEISLGQNPILKEIVRRYEEKHKIKIQSKDHIRFFRANEIIRFKANNNKTIIFLTNEKVVEINETIDNIEQQLENQPFLRLHEDHIINVNFISKIFNKTENNIELNDGTSLPVTEIRKEFIMNFLNKYI
ncbi:MAG: LytTR family transcriptional regulator [Bacteroidales bacterium]|nr:LytTR family transcriptional regulator [Bacteroidales bacterium]